MDTGLTTSLTNDTNEVARWRMFCDLDWVGDWLTFYLWPNGLRPPQNGVVGRTWVVGLEAESHVHHEIAF